MNDFEAVKNKINLAEFVRDRTGQPLIKAGASDALKECPFCGGHDCFRMDPNKQLWKCFQCDRGGDVFNFLTEEGMAKKDALREAASYAGVELKKAKPREPSLRQKILKAAAAYYEARLWSNGHADYLRDERGRSQATLEAMRVGFADGRLAEHLLAGGFKAPDIIASGMARENGQDTLRDFFPAGVFVYPHVAGGAVTHFTQKDPRKKVKFQLPAKYREASWRFYNQDALGRYNEIIVCEGENDVQAWMDLGARNVIGLIGQPSQEQIKTLRNFCKKKHLYLCLDNDRAGRKFTRAIINALSGPEYHIRVVVYEGAKDIDEYFRNCVKNRIQIKTKEVIGAARHPIAWEIGLAAGLGSLEEKLLALKEQKVFERIGELVDVEKEVYVEKLEALGFSRKAVEGQIGAGGAVRDRVAQYLGALSNKKDADPNTLAALIYRGFGKKGRWFFDREDKCYLFYAHRIYQVGSNRAFNALIKKNTGLLPTKEPGRSVWESLASDCYNLGSMVQVMSWLHTDRVRDVVYVNLNSDKNTILKIGAGSIEEIPNGTNTDEVLLSVSRRIMPFNYLPDCKIREGMRLLKELIFDNLTCEREQRYLLVSWIMSAFLIDFAPYAALMKFSGSTASGKTTAARLLSLLVYGSEHISDPTASAAYTVAAQNPLLVIDNLESEDMTKSLNRFLLLSATKGSKEKRAGGTDTETVEESPKALVIITAIEPFTKPEQINRTYDIEFSPRFKRDEFVEDDVVGEILKNRDLILSAVLKIIAFQVLPNLKKRREYNIILKKEYRGHSKARTDEYLALLMLLMDSALRYIPYYDEDEADLIGETGAREIRKRWIEYQNEKARDTETGTNPMVTMLNLLWREYGPLFERETEDYMPGVGNIRTLRHPEYGLDMKVHEEEGEKVLRFEASSADLFGVFSRLARNLGIRAPYKNPRQLGVRLINDEKALAEGGWRLEKGEGSNYLRILHGERLFGFKKVFKGGF